MTAEQLQKEFKKAEQVVDRNLKIWKDLKFDRDAVFLAVYNATTQIGNGPLMTALCFTIMAERLMNNKEKGNK